MPAGWGRKAVAMQVDFSGTVVFANYDALRKKPCTAKVEVSNIVYIQDEPD